MRPAPPGPRERGSHPTSRGRRACPALAPGGAHNRARLSPSARQRRSRGQRSLSFPASTPPSPAQTSGRQKRSSGQRTPQLPHLGRSPRSPRRKLWPVLQPGRPGRARAGPAVSTGSEAAGAGAGFPDDRQILPAWGRAFASVCFG